MLRKVMVIKMPIGVMVGSAAIALGGLCGSVVSSKLPERIKQQMNYIFAICALGMGVVSVVLMQNMPAVIFSVIVGTMIGLALRIGDRIQSFTGKVLSSKALAGFSKSESFDKELMLTAVVLFCFSCTGIYGSLDSGMTGDHSILLAKAILDFFTAMIFACQLGKAVSLIAIPQIVFFLLLFCLAKVIVPLASETMIADFKACGGFILLATGFRMLKLRDLPIADMIPAMLLAMPVSYAWTTWIVPLIG